MSCRARPTLESYFAGCLYFTTGRLYRTIDRMAADCFRGLDLSPSHAFLLLALHESPRHRAAPSALAETMNLDRSTVTRLLAGLERKGLVRREREGRTIGVTLRPEGAAILPAIHAGWRALYRRYGQEYGQEAADRLNRLIVRTTRPR